MTSYLDIFQLERKLNEKELQLAAQTKNFVDRAVLPSIGNLYAQESMPREYLNGLREIGALEQLAANELSPLAYGIFCRELERGSSGLRSFASVQGSLVMGTIAQLGSSEQKQKWLVPLGKLDKIGSFALTEPEVGSNPSIMQTKAVKRQNSYILNGEKKWVTNGMWADIFLVWAKLDNAITCFLVEKDTPGLEVTSIDHKWSFRTSITASIKLKNVEVGLDQKIEHATSIGKALKVLNWARYGIAWGVLGAAEACLQECLEYLGQRKQFHDRPLSSHQLIQEKLAWMATEISSMQLMCHALAELKVSEELAAQHISMAKMNHCRKAIEIARTCRELLGANGTLLEHHVGRRMLDLESVLTYEGTQNIHALILGGYLTGEKAF